jgi:hypothetical protein
MLAFAAKGAIQEFTVICASAPRFVTHIKPRKTTFYREGIPRHSGFSTTTDTRHFKSADWGVVNTIIWIT